MLTSANRQGKTVGSTCAGRMILRTESCPRALLGSKDPGPIPVICCWPSPFRVSHTRAAARWGRDARTLFIKKTSLHARDLLPTDTSGGVPLL